MSPLVSEEISIKSNFKAHESRITKGTTLISQMIKMKALFQERYLKLCQDFNASLVLGIFPRQNDSHLNHILHLIS